MKVRFTPRARLRIGFVDRWWRSNRSAAPSLFRDELDALLVRLLRVPLAVLSALAHGGEAVAEHIGKAAVRATEGLDVERRTPYWDIVYMAVHEAARRAPKALIMSSGYELRSELARSSFEKGRLQGEARGQARRAAEDVLDILDARGLVPTDEERARILASTDLDELRRWYRRAVTVPAVDQLFA